MSPPRYDTWKIRSSGSSADVAPDDPADAQRRQPELVARRADRLHPRQPEVPLDVGRAERGEERAARPVDVDVDVEPGVGLQLVERVGERLRPARRRRCRSRRTSGTTMIVFSSTRVEHVVGVHRVVARATSAPRASRCPSTWRTCATRPGPDRTPCSGGRSACRPPPASPASATWPPSRRACTPPTSRSPTRRRCSPTPGRSTGRRACARSAARSPRSAGTRPCRSCSCRSPGPSAGGPAGSSHVWQNVARFWRELPSSISSSATTAKASSARHSSVGEPVLRRRLGHVLAGVDGVVERGADGLTSVQRHGDLQCVRSERTAPADREHRPFRTIVAGGGVRFTQVG